MLWLKSNVLAHLSKSLPYFYTNHFCNQFNQLLHWLKINIMGFLAKKLVLVCCDQVRLNNACSATETSWNLEIFHVESLALIFPERK